MSEFEVDLGDGRTVVVDAPDAAQAANAARTFLSREKGSKPQGQSDAAANAFGQGATMGFGDEIAAGVRSAAPQFSNWMMQRPFDGKLTAGPVTNVFTTPDDPQRGVSGIKGGETLYTPPQPSPAQTVSNAPTQGQRYDEELARQRAQTKSDAEAYPVTTTGAGVAGTRSSGGGDAAAPALAPFRMLADDSTLSLRVFPDRSVADVFVQGGRWAGTVAWLAKDPRAPGDSSVALWSNATSTIVADIDVWSMGCGWADPSYTEHPTM